MEQAFTPSFPWIRYARLLASGTRTSNRLSLAVRQVTDDGPIIGVSQWAPLRTNAPGLFPITVFFTNAIPLAAGQPYFLEPRLADQNTPLALGVAHFPAGPTVVRGGAYSSTVYHLAFQEGIVLPVLTLTMAPGNAIQLVWPSAANEVFAIQRAGDLRAGFSNNGAEAATPPTNLYLDTSAPNGGVYS